MLQNNKTIITILMVLNAIVLIGQLWPQGAPPFARSVNIVFLLFSFWFFIGSLKNKSNDK